MERCKLVSIGFPRFDAAKVFLSFECSNPLGRSARKPSATVVSSQVIQESREEKAVSSAIHLGGSPRIYGARFPFRRAGRAGRNRNRGYTHIFPSLIESGYFWRLSMATAYAGLLYLAAALIIGPINVLRGAPNPLSINLRRDIGIVAGILALVHTIVGLFVHLRGDPIQYFFYRTPAGIVYPRSVGVTQLCAKWVHQFTSRAMLVRIIAVLPSETCRC
jgi:hypothetical protein